MILDKISNKDLYIKENPMFKAAFDFLEKYLENPLAPGKYEIMGEELFVKIDHGMTREEGFYEAHKEYIDLQVILEGEEKVLCDWTDTLKPCMDYDATEDVTFYNDGAGNIEFNFKAGEFMVLYPQDAHKPSMAIDAPAPIKKLVFKIKIK